MRHKLLIAVAASSLTLVSGGPLTGQDAGPSILEGVVRDGAAGAPLEGAVVTIQETGHTVETDARGRFVLGELPDGSVTLRVSMSGYGSVVEQVEASGALSGLLEILLPRMDALLQGIQVQGRRGDGRGTSAWGSDSDWDRHSTALDVLANNVPGVTMGTFFGEVGQGGGIQIRGVGSLQGSTSPQIFVDGIRVDESGAQDGPGTGFVKGVLESIPATQVDRIEVISGPAAAVRYGNGANGVILITTVRGFDPDLEERDEP